MSCFDEQSRWRLREWSALADGPARACVSEGAERECAPCFGGRSKRG